MLYSFVRFSTKRKEKSKDGLRRLVWMVFCWLGLVLLGGCRKWSRTLVSLSWWLLRSVWAALVTLAECWSGSGIKCWCGEARLIVPVIRVFLLNVSWVMYVGSRLWWGLWEGSHRLIDMNRLDPAIGQVLSAASDEFTRSAARKQPSLRPWPYGPTLIHVCDQQDLLNCRNQYLTTVVR